MLLIGAAGRGGCRSAETAGQTWSSGTPATTTSFYSSPIKAHRGRSAKLSTWASRCVTIVYEPGEEASISEVHGAHGPGPTRE